MRPRAGRALRRVCIAGAGLVVVVSLAGTPASGVGSPARGDPDDAEGPLDLAGVRLDQDGRSVVWTVRVRGQMPPLHALKRFPSRLAAADERYLCLQLEGRRVGRRLLCPGGKTSHRRVAVGVSSYGKAGATTRRGRLRARIESKGGRRIKLRFSLSDFEPGRFGWATLSGWTSAACSPPQRGARRRAGDRQRRGPVRPRVRRAENRCLDRAPDVGLAKGRFFELQRVGCSVASPLVNFHGSNGRKQIALTFDDGPSSYTASVMSILDRAGAKGTFFEVGDQIPGKAAVMQQVLRHGHEIGDHSLHHESFPGYASIHETGARIAAATGYTPCVFRPPGGAFNSGVVSAARSSGMSTVLWDVDTRDWTRPGSAAIGSRALAGAHPGAIILMHDGGGDRSETVAALPHVVATLKSRGYQLVTVTKILGEHFVWAEVH